MTTFNACRYITRHAGLVMYAFAWWWPDRTDPRALPLDQQLVRRELPV